MEERKKIFTHKKYLNRRVKCLETGIIYESIKAASAIIYGMEFKEFNNVGKMIENNRPIRGSHYIFID